MRSSDAWLVSSLWLTPASRDDSYRTGTTGCVTRTCGFYSNEEEEHKMNRRGMSSELDRTASGNNTIGCQSNGGEEFMFYIRTMKNSKHI
jgi:hypothetical protein